jgi:hypothetical protein
MRHLPQNRGATQRTENLRKEDGISKQQIKETKRKQKNNRKKMKHLPQNQGTTQRTENLRKKGERRNGISKQ